jgi:hypothetical protein
MRLRHLADRLKSHGARVVAATFLLSLPIGYYPTPTDSTKLYLGVHGGAGQVVAVIRDCSGDPLSSVSQGYVDASGSAYLPVSRSPLVLGFRGGFWHGTGTRLDYSWGNPCLGLETRPVGLGVGYVFGNVPWGGLDDRDDPVRFSAHLRFGNPRKFHFSANVAEMSPLLSGGGLVDAGFGYPIGSRLLMFSAVTAGFYDQPGFAQHARFQLSPQLDLEAAVRLGEADSKFEGSFSAGLRCALGR